MTCTSWWINFVMDEIAIWIVVLALGPAHRYLPSYETGFTSRLGWEESTATQ